MARKVDLKAEVTAFPVSVSGMITVPVSASMYQTVVANLQQIHTQGDGTMQVRIEGEDGLFQVVTPMVQVPKVEPANGSDGVETITMTPQQLLGTTHQVVSMGNESPQVLQVISLKDSSNMLAKSIASIKEEAATNDQ